ncbi:hypothetical protein P22_3394 [Propionispora sp. 2/2-37]|uniref:hypothetical protein n=1 Tax=Propionispora sp. 2/2-37 TaxID=1677858 RepID=UPI0006BB826E|nr:hypothetical protein [Propionispora sp. 2/2-37]CUH97267.1 hypothetical protein P22_3394 [Propionispora sp. 2/2-37]
MGLPKGLDFAGGAIVTLVLEDFQQLTGRFIGVFDDNRKQYKDPGCYKSDDSKYDPDHKYDDYDKHKHEHEHEDKCKPEPHDKCCKPPHVDVDVDVEDEREFLLLQLSEAAGAVTLTSATPIIVGGVVTGVTLGVTSTSFPAGSFVAVNVDQIIYAATGGVTTTFTIPITL